MNKNAIRTADIVDLFIEKVAQLEDDKVEIEELAAWNYLEDRFTTVLNKEYDLDEAIEDIKSFRNSEWYTGTKDTFKEIKDD